MEKLFATQREEMEQLLAEQANVILEAVDERTDQKLDQKLQPVMKGLDTLDERLDKKFGQVNHSTRWRAERGPGTSRGRCDTCRATPPAR